MPNGQLIMLCCYMILLVTFYLIGYLMSINILALKTESGMFQKPGVLEYRTFLISGM